MNPAAAWTGDTCDTRQAGHGLPAPGQPDERQPARAPG